jgi:COP9 signalosome complex subunit 7
MDQSLALNALAPYLALSKSATSPRAAADLISQATSAANTYVFAELLQQKNVQALQGHEQYGGHFELLKCFAWGTWEDYKGIVARYASVRLHTDLPI